MKLTWWPDTLFGRLLGAMLAAIGVTLVVIVALLLQERRDSLFSRTDTAAVVTAIATSAKTLAGLPPTERAQAVARLQRESLTVAGQYPPRRPDQDVDEMRSAARMLRSRLARELGRGSSVQVMPARPDSSAVIAVGSLRDGSIFDVLT